MKTKVDKSYKPIVIVGPCSTGKSVLSSSIFGLHDRLNVDSLITYMGFGSAVPYKELFDELEFYVFTQQYKVFDIGGSTISCMPPEFQARFKQIFKDATIVEIRPHPNDQVSYNFLKKMIMAEKDTPKNRKLELVEGVKYDLSSKFIKQIITMPTIYTLQKIKGGKKLLSPLMPADKMRGLYIRGLYSIKEQIAEEIANASATSFGE